MKHITRNSNKGFTLIELVVVIGILVILFAITLAAINPARQFAQARDTQRRNDVNAILNAVHQYAASENNGVVPSAINAG
jgi:prepilin-type N-terminal cleavage/methylation domain-containing protein